MTNKQKASWALTFVINPIDPRQQTRIQRGVFALTSVLMVLAVLSVCGVFGG